MLFPRNINIINTNSYIILGPRQTGKSTYLKGKFQENDLYYDLLQEETLIRLSQPGTFRKELELHLKNHKTFCCFVDEIQLLPNLLNEIHSFIENSKIRFLVTGSSARKLKKQNTNLTAGRMLSAQFFPCTFSELGENFNLDHALIFGMLPKVWNKQESQSYIKQFLISYSNTYLKQEILEEGLVRNIAPFSKFLELVAYESGEIVNYTRIASEVGISSKTIREHYTILEDTFLGFFLSPFGKSKREQIIQHPKFYLFDCGITNALAKVRFESLNPSVFGTRFEQFIITQLKAHLSYNHIHEDLYYWRTKKGAEIDLICGSYQKPRFAIEIKSNPNDVGNALKSFDTFLEDYPNISCYIVSPMKQGRLHRTKNNNEVTHLPWEEFFKTVLAAS